ncbi:MAG: urate hydroxylase PuuD, partial [Deltaproteobacteria bacterium]|nr:urate hydroxylase PuuD [Deltaproteobacteria bacterium]
VVRWIHVITGIAWIGASFFFNWLDSQLTPPENPEPKVEGELWMIHSGGFYQLEKTMISPSEIPRVLHWFKWEAYSTWISGIFLLGIVYYTGSGVYLIDSQIADLSYGMAISISLGSILAGWLVYDFLWASSLGEKGWLPVIISFVLLFGIIWWFHQWFGSRAAYIHVGAVMGTLMVGNVWRRIIPSQTKLVEAVKAGKTPEASLGIKAKQRSIHNNYMTLPVVFIMISNHFPNTFAHQMNWMILIAIIVIGATVRHFFNLKNKGHLNIWILPLAMAAIFALIFVSKPAESIKSSSDSATFGTEHIPFALVRTILDQRCVSCHSITPTDEVFRTAPKGIMFDNDKRVKALASLIKTQAVSTMAMPLGNKTGISLEERIILGRWIEEGASIE